MPKSNLTDNAQKTESLNHSVQNLSNQIVANLNSNKNVYKTAVYPFSDLNNNVTNFGIHLSEVLTTYLFASNKFKLLERHHLKKIFEEQGLNFHRYIDEKTAIKLGKIAGADAICSGSITEFKDYISIHARLLSTETGEIYSVAKENIIKNSEITVLVRQKEQLKSTENSLDIIISKLQPISDINGIPDQYMNSPQLANLVQRIKEEKYQNNFIKRMDVLISEEENSLDDPYYFIIEVNDTLYKEEIITDYILFKKKGKNQIELEFLKKKNLLQKLQGRRAFAIKL